MSVASDVRLRVEAEDSDGSVVSAEFFRDGESVATSSDTADGVFEAELVVSGADENGSTTLQVVVTDNDGNTAEAELDANFDLPNGGLIEAWNFDNGIGSSVYAIRPRNDSFIWTGTVEVGGNSVLRVDGEDGLTWNSTQNASGSFGSDVIERSDGTFLVAGSNVSGGGTMTGLYQYTPGGTPAGQQIINGAPMSGLDNWPLALEVDLEERPYLLGVYVDGSQSASYLARLSDDLSLEWQRDITGSPTTDGEPFAYDFDVRGDGMVAVVGNRLVGTDKLWFATYDASGDLQEQVTLTSEFDTSLGYDIAWHEDGGLVVSGTVLDGGNWGRFVRSYDDALLEEWTVEGNPNDDFAQAVTTDPFGRTVVVSTETCTPNLAGGLFDTCRLVVRSYDREGQLRWQHQAEGGEPEFNGPVLWLPGFKADVETDRYGFVYVSAQHRLPLGKEERRSEWWAEKHHP